MGQTSMEAPQTASGNLEAGRISIAWDWLVLLCLPFALLAVDPSWIVSPWIRDPWVYFGYYLDLPAHLKTFGQAYFSTRLSVILPGWLAHSLLPAYWANLALHLGLWYVSVGALYATVWQTVGRRAAFLAAVLLGSNSFFLSAVGSDYVDGFGIAYLLAATWLTTRATASRWWVSHLFLAGGACGAVVVANLTYVSFLPFLLLQHMISQRGRRRWVGTLVAGLGMIAILAALGGINWSLGGQFLFLEPSLRFVGHYSRASDSNPMSTAWYGLIPTFGWLYLPLLGALAPLGIWAARRGAGCDARPALAWTGWFYPLQAVGLLLWYALLTFSEKSTLLQWPYYVSLLIPSAILSLSLFFHALAVRIESREFRWLAVLSVVAAISTAATHRRILSSSRVAGTIDSLDWPWLLVGLVFGVAALLLAWRRGAPAVAGTLLLLCVASLAARQCHDDRFTARSGPQRLRELHARSEELLAPDAPYRWNHATSRGKQVNVRPLYDRWYPFTPIRGQILPAVASTVRFINEFGGRDAFIWFDVHEPNAMLFDTIAFAKLRLLSAEFPDLGSIQLWPGARLVVLAEEYPDPVAAAQPAAAKMGLSARALAQRTIKAGSIAFTVTIIELVTPPGSQ